MIALSSSLSLALGSSALGSSALGVSGALGSSALGASGVFGAGLVTVFGSAVGVSPVSAFLTALSVWGKPSFSTYVFTSPSSPGSMYWLIRSISSADFPISPLLRRSLSKAVSSKVSTWASIASSIFTKAFLTASGVFSAVLLFLDVIILAAASGSISGNVFLISWVASAMAFPRIPFSTLPLI